MCLDERKFEIAIVRETKLYLEKNQKDMIEKGINNLLKSDKEYKIFLTQNKEKFHTSLSWDFKLMIDFCNTLDKKVYKNRTVVDNAYPIYKDFYQYLYTSYIKNKTLDKKIKQNLKETFKAFSKKNFNG